jgi:formamidopyrimidine-DNA glycosylase
MPELPEVETIVRQLHKGVAGRTLQEVRILKSGREFPSGQHFIKRVENRLFKEVRRRAKVIIFQFEDGSAMICHLKMTGKFLFVDEKYIPAKHDRILFVFKSPNRDPISEREGLGEGKGAGEVRVVWSDVRMFGYLKHLSPKELEVDLSKYGPEPLETSVDELAERLVKPKTRRVKSALLDQATIAGIGNIYADEACFRAGIRPMRILASLKEADRLRLAKEVVAVLKESVKRKGTSSDDYRDATGKKGNFQSFLNVYGRGGQPCRVCGTPIKKIVQAGRGTHYCPNCQK